MYVLRLNCTDKPGIVAAVAALLSENGCNIEESAQFHDKFSEQFFMRLVYSGDQKSASGFAGSFESESQKLEIDYSINDLNEPVKTLLMVSKEDHCLNDLLYRWRRKTLNIDVTAIVSNHKDANDLASRYGLPFFYLPVTPDTKAEQEKAVADIADKTDTHLIVMARYMQILSDEFCSKFENRVINIHHSFLPGFKGAKPYHQAYERGVKIIGASAHFANADLDEGPIITQNVVPVDHRHDPEHLKMLGQDIETRTLAQAVRLYAQRRIFAHSGRTVIL